MAKAQLDKKRCSWSTKDQLYRDYHDNEWGVPLHDDQMLFEFLTLESFQAGLSWYTVLKKRENFRKAFLGFDPQKVARFTDAKFDRLMADAGIIRNRLKIKAAINNAKQFIKIQNEFGSFDDYQWGFVDGSPLINKWKTLSQMPTTTPLSDKLSKDLKDRGFKFMGSTVVYSHMQATGMVMDHLPDCFRFNELSC